MDYLEETRWAVKLTEPNLQMDATVNVASIERSELWWEWLVEKILKENVSFC